MTLTQERLKELLHYDPETGIFTNRVRRANFIAGSRAGRFNKSGHRAITIDYVSYYEHRLAWLYMTGEWPKDKIDHIDCNQANNIFANLRESTQAQNTFNARTASHNTSRVKGVSWSARYKKWRATISVGNRAKHLGSFLSKDDAAAAYAAEAVRLRGEFARLG